MDNLYDFGFVKFISRFYSPDRIGVWINKVIQMYNTNSFKERANTLFAWAIILIILGTAIDIAFYWTRPEQQVILIRYISRIRDRLSRGRN